MWVAGDRPSIKFKLGTSLRQAFLPLCCSSPSTGNLRAELEMAGGQLTCWRAKIKAFVYCDHPTLDLHQGGQGNYSSINMSYGRLLIKVDTSQGLHLINTINIEIIAASAPMEWRFTSSHLQGLVSDPVY